MRLHQLAAIGTLALLAACEAAPPAAPLERIDDGAVRGAEVGFVDGPFGTPPGMDPRAKWMVWPDTVTAGVPFTVTVRTAGSRCRDVSVTELSYAEDNRTAIVVPYDAEHQGVPIADDDTLAAGNHACPNDLVFLERRVTLQFDSPGAATIVLRGRYFYQGQPAEHSVTLHVR